MLKFASGRRHAVRPNLLAGADNGNALIRATPIQSPISGFQFLGNWVLRAG